MQTFRQKARKKAPLTKKGRNKGEEEAPDPKSFKLHELSNGPGKLCMAFDIRRDNCDKLDLATSDEMWLEESDDPHYNGKGKFETVVAKRVGIDSAPAKARDQLWRFYIQNNMFVSTVKPSQFKRISKADDDE